MRSYKNELEAIANDLLTQNAEAKGNENKPNYSNRDFMKRSVKPTDADRLGGM